MNNNKIQFKIQEYWCFAGDRSVTPRAQNRFYRAALIPRLDGEGIQSLLIFKE